MDVAEDPRTLKRTRGGRDRLLAAAAELFGTHTLAGTSLQMIADRLGVTKAAIYHHFASRDEIVDALMQPVFADVNAGVARIRQLPAGERSAATREFYADFAVAHRRVISMVFFDRGALKPDDAAEVDRLVDAVSPLLSGRDDAEGMAAGEILVYGLAALVTRRAGLEDPELRTLLGQCLAAVPASHDLPRRQPLG